MSKQHGMHMFKKNDQAHLDAMNKMRELMNSANSGAMKKWMKSKRDEFDALPDTE